MDWLESYLAYTSYQVSPRLFHLWSGIATIGAALGRNVWLDRGYFRIYPAQLMVVLVSGSAVSKKTTAGGIAVEFLKGLEPWQVNVLPAKLSPQQLLYCLARTDEEKMPMRDPQGRRVPSTGFIWAGELGKFFSTESFADTLATHINDLNDAPRGKVRVEFRSWKAELWNPCVGMLGCITPKGMADELPKAARTVGFFGRILWVAQNHTDRANPLTRLPPDRTQQKRALQVEMKEIAKMEGAFRWTIQGRDWFEDWYMNTYFPAMQDMERSGMNDTGYWGRKDSHLLRVAMVMSAATRRDRLLTRRDLKRALKALNEIERYFPLAMAEMGTNPYTDYERKVLSYLEIRGKGTGWVDERKIMAVLWRHGGKRRFEDAVETLVAAGEIERRRKGDHMEICRIRKSGAQIRRATEEGPPIAPRL